MKRAFGATAEGSEGKGRGGWAGCLGEVSVGLRPEVVRVGGSKLAHLGGASGGIGLRWVRLAAHHHLYLPSAQLEEGGDLRRRGENGVGRAMSCFGGAAAICPYL